MSGTRNFLPQGLQLRQRLIELSGVGVTFDRRPVLTDVDLDVCRGDFIAITGPNGGGKTTLLRVILRLLRPDAGSVSYASRTMRIGYLPQKNMIDSRFPIVVRDVIASGLLGAQRNVGREERDDKVVRCLRLVGLEEHASKPIGALSGGQLQRALLGRAVISGPEVLVLDEPLSYVDKRFEHKIYDIVRELSASTTILLVSHEMSTIAGMASRHLIVDRCVHECTAAHHYVRMMSCDDGSPEPEVSGEGR